MESESKKNNLLRMVHLGVIRRILSAITFFILERVWSCRLNNPAGNFGLKIIIFWQVDVSDYLHTSFWRTIAVSTPLTIHLGQP